jgi:hypothetical protein
MDSEYNINFGLDIALHVLILFTFLTVFFFAYISKLEKQNLNNVTDGLIDEKTNDLLNTVDQWQNKLNTWNTNFDIKIDWNTVDNIADNLIEKSKDQTPKIKENNDKLFKESMIIISSLFILFIGIVVFLMLLGYNIHLKHIIIVNVIIFSLTGLVEYLFFTNVASKYIPVNPNFTTNTILDRLKKNI